MKHQKRTPGDRGVDLSEGLVRVDDAATYLACSRSHIYALMEQGALPFVHLGRGRRIPRGALHRFAASHLH